MFRTLTILLFSLTLAACSTQGGIARSYVISEKEELETPPLLSDDKSNAPSNVRDQGEI